MINLSNFWQYICLVVSRPQHTMTVCLAYLHFQCWKSRRNNNNNNNNLIYWAEDVLQNINCMQAAEITLRQWRNGAVSCPLLRDVICSERIPFCCCRRLMVVQSTFFVPNDLDLWPWHSNSSEWETKHIFPLNLAQIRSAVPKIFDSQTKTTNN